MLDDEAESATNCEKRLSYCCLNGHIQQKADVPE